MKSIAERIAEELNVRVPQVDAAIALLDDKATVPFIARYRKEATGGLDDTQLRTLEERLTYLRELEERRAAILKSIEEQGKLTPELAASIRARRHQGAARRSLPALQAEAAHEGADRARSRPRAARARACCSDPTLVPERGGRGLRRRRQGRRRRRRGARRRALDPDGDVRRGRGARRRPAPAAVGSRRVDSRRSCRARRKKGAKFSDYFSATEPVKQRPVASRARAACAAARKASCASRVTLPDAERRGRSDRAGAAHRRARRHRADSGRAADAWLAETVRWTWKVKLLPHLELDVEQRLREEAEAEAIRVFGRNLHDLLLAAPAGQRVTMGLDPGHPHRRQGRGRRRHRQAARHRHRLSARAAQRLGRRAAHARRRCARRTACSSSRSATAPRRARPTSSPAT